MIEESKVHLSDDERSRERQIRKRVNVEAGTSPAIPTVFFAVCFVGILLMMFGPFAFGVLDWYVVYVGGLMVALGLLSAGFLAKNISQTTRLGLVLGGALVVGLAFWFFQILFDCWRIW